MRRHDQATTARPASSPSHADRLRQRPDRLRRRRRRPAAGGPTAAPESPGGAASTRQGRHHRLRAGRPDRGDLRRARQPRADRPRRLDAGRPADAHQRRRELPGLPRRHPGPGADGRCSAPRRSASARTIVDVDIDRVDFSQRPFRLWARGVEYRGEAVIVATGASALWLGLESETRLRGRGVSRLRDLRRVLLPRQGDRGRRRRRHRPRGGDLPDPLRDQGPPAPPARRRSGQPRSWSTGRSPTPRSRSTRNTGGRRGPRRGARSRACGCATRRPARSASWPLDGLFIAIGHKPEHGRRSATGSRSTRRATSSSATRPDSEIDGVFIAGDVHDHRYRQAVTAAGDGCKAAIDAERWLESRGHRRSRHADGLVAGGRSTGMGFQRRGRMAGGGPAGRDVRPRRATSPPRRRRERRGRTIRRIVAFFRPYRAQVAIVLGRDPARPASLGLVNPILLKLLIDDAIPQRDLDLLNLYVGLMIVLPIVSGLIGVGQSYLNNVIGQNVMQDLRDALYAHLQRMPLRFFTETRTGEIQSRLANDVGGIQSVVTDTAASLTSNVAIAISTIIAMFLIDWRLTLLSLGIAAVLHVPDLPRRQGPPRGQRRDPEVAGRDVRRDRGDAVSVSGMLLSKTFGQQAASIDRFSGLNRRARRAPDPPGDGRPLVLHDHRHDLLDHPGVRVLAGRLPGHQRRPERADDRRHRRLHDAPEPAVLPARASCSTCRSRSRARSRCSTGSSSTSSWTPRSSMRPTRSPSTRATVARRRPLPRRLVPLPDRAASRRGRPTARPADAEPDAEPAEVDEAAARAGGAAADRRGGARCRRGFGLERHRLRGPAGRARRARRPVRRGQDDHDLPDPAAVRRRRRRGRDRRPRRPPDHARVARARSIGFVTQETYLFHASIRDNLLLRPARGDRRRARGRGRARPRSTTGSSSCPRATTRSSASAATSSRAARSSASRSPGSCSRTRGS